MHLWDVQSGPEGRSGFSSNKFFHFSVSCIINLQENHLGILWAGASPSNASRQITQPHCPSVRRPAAICRPQSPL